MLYLIIYFGIGFLGGMFYEYLGFADKIFDNMDGTVSIESRVLGKILVQLIITVYWPLVIACIISLLIDSKKD